MKESGLSFYYSEPQAGGSISISQIQKGDIITVKATYKDEPVREASFVAQYDRDSQEFLGSRYDFTLVKRPKPKPNFPQTRGAIIKFPSYVPVILTKSGWLFTSKVSDGYDLVYHTPEGLADYVGARQAADFKVLYAGD